MDSVSKLDGGPTSSFDIPDVETADSEDNSGGSLGSLVIGDRELQVEVLEANAPSFGHIGRKWLLIGMLALAAICTLAAVLMEGNGMCNDQANVPQDDDDAIFDSGSGSGSGSGLDVDDTTSAGKIKYCTVATGIAAASTFIGLGATAVDLYLKGEDAKQTAKTRRRANDPETATGVLVVNEEFRASSFTPESADSSRQWAENYDRMIEARVADLVNKTLDERLAREKESSPSQDSQDSGMGSKESEGPTPPLRSSPPSILPTSTRTAVPSAQPAPAPPTAKEGSTRAPNQSKQTRSAFTPMATSTPKQDQERRTGRTNLVTVPVFERSKFSNITEL